VAVAERLIDCAAFEALIKELALKFGSNKLRMPIFDTTAPEFCWACWLFSLFVAWP